MKEIIATITNKGQVTIPAEVRKTLGLKKGDQIAFAIEEQQVLLKPVRFTLETAFGSVPPLAQPSDFEQQIRDAKAERAKEQAP